MKLAPTSQMRLEAFLREHLDDDQLRLPRLHIHSGPLARFITKSLKVGAITIGRHILFSPALLAPDDKGRLTAPGWLIAHEAVHVVQYAKAGYIRFFFRYLRGYFKALRVSGRWDAAARMAAYLAIAEECAAHAAEDAYRVWSSVRAEKGD